MPQRAARSRNKSAVKRRAAAPLIALIAALIVSVSAGAASHAANPCAAKNPLNPCAPGHIQAPDADLALKPAVAETIYRSLRKEMAAVFALSGKSATRRYQSWRRYNKTPYQSTEHGNRYLNNYVNKTAQAYGKFE
jgi:hypothetical protein